MADPIHGHYRTKEELEEQKAKDPIERLVAQLTDAELLSDDVLSAMRTAVDEEVADALTCAEQSPDPEPGELYTDVYQD